MLKLVLPAKSVLSAPNTMVPATGVKVCIVNLIVLIIKNSLVCIFAQYSGSAQLSKNKPFQEWLGYIMDYQLTVKVC